MEHHAGVVPGGALLAMADDRQRDLRRRHEQQARHEQPRLSDEQEYRARAPPDDRHRVDDGHRHGEGRDGAAVREPGFRATGVTPSDAQRAGVVDASSRGCGHVDLARLEGERQGFVVGPPPPFEEAISGDEIARRGCTRDLRPTIDGAHCIRSVQRHAPMVCQRTLEQPVQPRHDLGFQPGVDRHELDDGIVADRARQDVRGDDGRLRRRGREPSDEHPHR